MQIHEAGAEAEAEAGTRGVGWRGGQNRLEGHDAVGGTYVTLWGSAPSDAPPPTALPPAAPPPALSGLLRVVDAEAAKEAVATVRGQKAAILLLTPEECLAAADAEGLQLVRQEAHTSWGATKLTQTGYLRVHAKKDCTRRPYFAKTQGAHGAQVIGYFESPEQAALALARFTALVS